MKVTIIYRPTLCRKLRVCLSVILARIYSLIGFVFTMVCRSWLLSWRAHSSFLLHADYCRTGNSFIPSAESSCSSMRRVNDAISALLAAKISSYCAAFYTTASLGSLALSDNGFAMPTSAPAPLYKRRQQINGSPIVTN